MKSRIINSLVGIIIGSLIGVFLGAKIETALSTFIAMTAGYLLCVHAFYDKIKEN